MHERDCRLIVSVCHFSCAEARPALAQLEGPALLMACAHRLHSSFFFFCFCVSSVNSRLTFCDMWCVLSCVCLFACACAEKSTNSAPPPSGSGSGAVPAVRKPLATPAPGGVTKTKGKRAGVPAAGGKAEEVKRLEEQLEAMRVNVEGLERERDFYFGKLRDIEVLCEGKEEGPFGEFVATVTKILSVDSHCSVLLSFWGQGRRPCLLCVVRLAVPLTLVAVSLWLQVRH